MRAVASMLMPLPPLLLLVSVVQLSLAGVELLQVACQIGASRV